MTLVRHLSSLGACAEARRWAKGRKAAEAWAACEQPEWMIWWAARTPANSQMAIVRAASACARTALEYAPLGEDRPRLAIEAAEAWADNPCEETRRAAAAYAKLRAIIRLHLVLPWEDSDAVD